MATDDTYPNASSYKDGRVGVPRLKNTCPACMGAGGAKTGERNRWIFCTICDGQGEIGNVALALHRARMKDAQTAHATDHVNKFIAAALAARERAVWEAAARMIERECELPDASWAAAVTHFAYQG